MNRTVSLLVIAATFFVGGVLSCIGVDWLFKVYLFPPVTIRVRGVLKVQSSNDPTASANPPNGYFVESSATDRFYVEGDLVKPYVGSLIQLTGILSTVCGPDGYPCYPKLQTKSVFQVKGLK
jgi:hypothetical protein